MQAIVFETEKFRNALNTIRPFADAEEDCYPDSDYNGLVEIVVDGGKQTARLAFRGWYFQMSMPLPCRASQGTLNIYAKIDDLILYVDDIEDEEFMVAVGGLEDKKEGDIKIRIFDEDGERLIGKVDAHYAKKEFGFCDIYYSSNFFFLPQSFVADTLRAFSEFTNTDNIHREQAFVWYIIDTAETEVVAYTSTAIKRQFFDYGIEVPQTFGFMGHIAEALADLIEKCANVKANCAEKFYSVACDDIFIEMYAPEDRHRNYVLPLLRFKPTHEIEVAKVELLDFLKQAINSGHWFSYTMLHTKGSYTRLHCIDAGRNISMRKFIVNDGYAEDTTLCLSTYMLESCLKNVKSPKVRLQFTDASRDPVSITASNEPYNVRNAQIVMQKLLSDDEQEIMQYNDSVLDKEIAAFDDSRNTDNGLEIIKVGDVFSRHPIPLDGGDHIIPVITDYGIDVVMCFNSPSLKERKAFSDELIELHLVETRTIPFIILKFGNQFTQQFALNVAGMNPYYRSLWLNDPDRSMLRLFLVNSDNAVLVAMRLATLRLMDDIKNVCKKQLDLSHETVNSYIAQTESYLSIAELLDMAEKFELIETSDIKL